MGLLDKSEKIVHNEINKSANTRVGLLERAEKLKLKDRDNGLLKRAEKIRSDIDNEKNENSKTQAETVPEKKDLFAEWENEAKEKASQLSFKEGTSIEPEYIETKYLFDDDSAYATIPADFQIASKRKVENYQSIFEITKEIASSNSYEDFFENLTFSILGQLGSESILIFSATNGKFDTLYIMDFQGVNPEAGWNFTVGDEVYTVLNKRHDIVFARELIEKGLPDKERQIILEAKADILIPLNHNNLFFGIIILGKPLGSDEYTADDLEFLKIIAEISGSMVRKIFEVEEQVKEIEHFREVIKMNQTVFSLSKELANKKTIDEAFDYLIESLKSQLSVEKFTFYLFDYSSLDHYKIFASNIFSPETIERYLLPIDSDLVGMVANVMGVYNLKDYLQSPELKKFVPNDEISLLDEFIVLPLISLDWLVGLFVVHSTSGHWTDSTREAAIAIMESVSPVFANILMMEEKRGIFSGRFSPLSEWIEKEVIRSQSLQIDFSILLIKIQNISRSVNMMGASNFSRYCDDIRKITNEIIGDMDHIYRIGQASFCVVLDGRRRKEAEIVQKKILSKVADFYLANDFIPILEKKLISFPDDVEEKDEILQMIDEF